MFFRYFVALCAVALCAVAINAEIEEDIQVQDIDVDVDERLVPAVMVVTKLIGSIFAGAAVSCVSEAATTCKQHWKNPGAAMSCAKKFLGDNKGRCAVGK